MIARKSALIIVTNILKGIIGYVALYFITRYMTPEDYGIVAFALGFVTLFSIFGDLGFNSAHIKRVSEGKNLGECIGTYAITKIGLTGLMATLALSAVFIWKFILGRGFESSTHEMAIYIMIGYWVLRLLASIFITTFSARKEIAKNQTPEFLETVFRVGATIYVAIDPLNQGFGAIALALTYVIGDVVHLFSSLYLFRGYPIKKPSYDFFKSYFVFAFPVVIASACHLIISNSDKVLIQLFWSAEDVGYYFSAFNFSLFINLFTLSVGTLLLPTFSNLHIKDNINKIRKLTLQSDRYLSMIVFPMVFGMVTLAKPTVEILLSGWMPVVPILQILPFFVLFGALDLPYGSQLLGIDKPKLVRNRVLIMVCFNIILNIILIPSDIQTLGLKLVGWGARGAAVATVISYFIGLLYTRVMTWKLTKTKGNPHIILHALAAGVMAVVLYLMLYDLNIIVFIERWYHLLVIAFLGLGIYLFILFLFKEFRRKDYDFLMDTLNIRKMLKYIKQELRGK